MACNLALSATTQAFRHNGKFPMAHTAPFSPETFAYSPALKLFPAIHSPDEPFISLGTVLMLFKAQQVSAAPGVESSRKLARLASDQISPFGPLIHCLQVTCDWPESTSQVQKYSTEMQVHSCRDRWRFAVGRETQTERLMCVAIRALDAV